MIQVRPALVISLWVLFASLLPGRLLGGQGPLVALFTMEDKGSGLKSRALDNLTYYLSAQLSECGYQVIPRDQIRARLVGEKRKTYKACFDQSCQIELGRELAAQKILSTRILGIGGTCQVTSVLFDLRKSATEMAATGEAKCNEKSLLSAVKKVAAKLCRSLHDVGDTSEKPSEKPSEFDLFLQTTRKGQERRQKTKKAWEVIQRIVADQNEPADNRIRALQVFLVEFKEKNPYRPEAERLLANFPGALAVTTEPPGAMVLVNGEPFERSPFTKEIRPGEYRIEAVLQGFLAPKRQVSVEPGKKTTVSLSLERMSPGTLTVSTVPPGAWISVQGEDKEASPISKNLMPGEYSLEAFMPGYATAKKLAQVSDGEKTEVTLYLEEPFNNLLWGHVSFWTGLGLAGFGGLAAGLAASAADDYDAGNDVAWNTSTTWAGLMWTGFVTGAALMATGVILWTMSPDEQAPSGQQLGSVGLASDGHGLIFSFGGSW